MKNKSKAPNLVVIAVLSVITVIFWIGFSIFRAFTTEPEPKVPPEILAPLNPTLDQDALNRLERRQWLSESEIGDTQLVIETPTPSPTPTSTPEAEEEASPAAQEATTEGTINEETI